MWCIKLSHQVSYTKQYALGICEQFSTLQDLGQISHALIHLKAMVRLEHETLPDLEGAVHPASKPGDCTSN